MDSILIKNEIVIPLKFLSVEDRKYIQERYKFCPTPGYAQSVLNARPPSPTLLFSINLQGGYIKITRDLALLSKFLENDKLKIKDEQFCENRNLEFIFTKPLDETRQQISAVNACLQMLTKSDYGGGCLLCLPPGKGKTACAIKISQELKSQRTLILVHTSSLQVQWKERLETFLEGPLKIQILTAKNRVIDPESTHVIVLMQTILCMKESDIPPVHLLIADECHHVCASTLHKTISMVGGKYRLGLSATPERTDGLTPMLYCLIGNIAFQSTRSEHDKTMLGQIVVHKYTYKEYDRKEINQSESVSTLITHVSNCTRRTEFICQIVQSIFTSEQRKIIVLSDRREQLYNLKEKLEKNNELGADMNITMIIGGVKGKDVEVASEGDVILATYAYCSEGLDIPSLDTCLLATPKVNMIQCVGRVLRPVPGKKHPLIIDIVDSDYTIFTNQFNKRQQYYKKKFELGGLDAIITSQKTNSDPFVQDIKQFMLV
jgi:superfamily II DNA or RNA helicase